MKITITPSYLLQVRAECVDFLRVADGVETVLICLTHDEYRKLQQAMEAAENITAYLKGK